MDESEKSDFEKKIGSYARDYFTVYFSNTNKQYDIKNFLNKYWCNENLGICYPLLKEVDISKPISDQKNYNNEYARYWSKPVLQINGKHYIICSQWFKEFWNKLDMWISSQNEYPNIFFDESFKRTKDRCLHYDYRKNQCICTELKDFRLQCENFKSCRKYIETKFPIYIVPKNVIKHKKCPFCNNITEKEFVRCTYKTVDKSVENNLLTYRCKICERNYIADTLYINYCKNKNIDDLDVCFRQISDLYR